MSRALDLTGIRSGRLVAIERNGYRICGNAKQIMWLCKCDCGNTSSVYSCDISHGKIRSCGCLKKEAEKKPKRITHNKSKTRLYRIWDSVKRRCCSPTKDSFKQYGGRGIKVCDEWMKDFTAFYDWAMSNGYADDLTLDRIDVNGNYEPDNCRWVTYLVQQNNKRNNVVVNYCGETHTISEWSRIIGINEDTLRQRFKRGYTAEQAFTKEVSKRVRIKKCQKK